MRSTSASPPVTRATSPPTEATASVTRSGRTNGVRTPAAAASVADFGQRVPVAGEVVPLARVGLVGRGHHRRSDVARVGDIRAAAEDERQPTRRDAQCEVTGTGRRGVAGPEHPSRSHEHHPQILAAQERVDGQLGRELAGEVPVGGRGGRRRGQLVSRTAVRAGADESRRAGVHHDADIAAGGLVQQRDRGVDVTAAQHHLVVTASEVLAEVRGGVEQHVPSVQARREARDVVQIAHCDVDVIGQDAARLVRRDLMETTATSATARGAATREHLIAAARELLSSGGIDAVTLRAVSARAMVSRTAPYRHFADKEDLLAALAAAELTRLGDELAAAAASEDDPLARLQAMGVAYVEFAFANPQQYQLMFGPHVRGRAHPELTDQAGSATFGHLVRAVGDAQRAGRLRDGDPAALAALIWSAGHGAVDLALAGDGRADKRTDDPTALSRLLLEHLSAS